jgi:hypothetical protein
VDAKAKAEREAKPPLPANLVTRLAGRWYGKIARWDYDTDHRDLVVDPDGSCRWDLPKPGGPGRAKACTVDDKAGTIDLITGADTTVRLKLDGGTLAGTFQLKRGQIFQVSFRRESYP